MKSTGLGGYLSLINSHSPKTHQNFSFSDTEAANDLEESSDEQEAERPQRPQQPQRLPQSSKSKTFLELRL